jgi:hypothetical protein
MPLPDLNPIEEQALTLAATGRVSAYTTHADEIDDLTLRCGAAGYSYAQTAACIGVSMQSLKKWAAEHPRFNSVLERAQTLSQAWWEGRAMDGHANQIIGGSIWSRSMAARFPQDYTERKEINNPDGNLSPYRELTEHELAKELERRGLPIPDLD